MELIAGWMLLTPFVLFAGNTVSLPTFSHDISIILNTHCVTCHRPGQSAPFSLIGYGDAAKRASLIAKVTASHQMPPWKPEPGYGHFAAERRLSGEEISLLRRWAEGGAPEGDRSKTPPPPVFPGDWQLGPPDLIVEMPHAFEVPAEGPDIYQCFSVPLRAKRTQYVRAIEFRPSDPRVVHHAILFNDPHHIGQKNDTGSGYSCFGGPGALPAIGLGGWSPGNQPIQMPAVAPAILRQDSGLIVQLHFHPTGKPETERSRIGFYFTDTAPERHVQDIALGSRRIDIAPGDARYLVTDHFEIPVDVDLYSIIPHAHFLCREMRGFAILPNGRKQWLIWIKDWDFNWQDQFRYATPVRLPAGTKVHMEFFYDNSDRNPKNPNRPPKEVFWGSGVGDEMAGLHLNVIPVAATGAQELSQALWGKMMRDVGGGFYRQ